MKIKMTPLSVNIDQKSLVFPGLFRCDLNWPAGLILFSNLWGTGSYKSYIPCKIGLTDKISRKQYDQLMLWRDGKLSLSLLFLSLAFSLWFFREPSYFSLLVFSPSGIASQNTTSLFPRRFGNEIPHCGIL